MGPFQMVRLPQGQQSVAAKCADSLLFKYLQHWRTAESDDFSAKNNFKNLYFLECSVPVTFDLPLPGSLPYLSKTYFCNCLSFTIYLNPNNIITT
jgi:hypothetical protein